MSKKHEAVAKLDQLLTDTIGSKKGRILEVFEKIVELRRQRVSIEEIETILNEVYFVNDNLKKGSLSDYLYQIKKDKKKANGVVEVTAVSPVSASAEVAAAIPESKTTHAVSKHADAAEVISKQAQWEKEARDRNNAAPRR